MKTRDFTSDAEVAALVSAFEKATIPASEFKHVAHIAVALRYLNDMPPDAALERMREKIRAFAAHHGVSNLYHETLTTFWMRLLDHVSAYLRCQSSVMAAHQPDRGALGNVKPREGPLLARANRIETRPRSLDASRSPAIIVLNRQGTDLRLAIIHLQ